MENKPLHDTRYGIIRQEADTFSVRFERHLNHPVEKVWEAITDPAKLSIWLANVSIELQEDGNITVAFTNTDSTAKGRITELKKLSVIEYTWQWEAEPVSVVRWELTPTSQASCHLVFSHSGLTGPIPMFGAGWHGHLDLLSDMLDGKIQSFSWSEAAWKERCIQYEFAFQNIAKSGNEYEE